MQKKQIAQMASVLPYFARHSLDLSTKYRRCDFQAYI